MPSANVEFLLNETRQRRTGRGYAGVLGLTALASGPAAWWAFAARDLASAQVALVAYCNVIVVLPGTSKLAHH